MAALQARRRLLRHGLALAGCGLLGGCQGNPPPLPERVARRPLVGLLTWSAFSGGLVGLIQNSLRQGLRELGYSHGDVDVEVRTAELVAEYPRGAAELVELQPAVIIAANTEAALAIRQLAPTLPVVFVDCGDPVGTGLAASLARPGGSITGLSTASAALSAKRLSLLLEAFPSIGRVAVLRYPGAADTALEFAATASAASALGLRLLSFEVRDSGEILAALEVARQAGADALLTFYDLMTAQAMNRSFIVSFGLAQRLPTMFDRKDPFVRIGGLLSYGPNQADQYRRAARYVDQILRGRKPADLPVELPASFELVVNQATAQRTGLAIPQSILLQATEIVR